MNGPRMLIAATQGIWLRATVKPAPPAVGPDHGTVVGGPPADGPPADGSAAGGSAGTLRVVVLGDSTAAGCGVATHEDGFAGCLARDLAARTGRPVAWRAVGQFGATGTRIRHQLLPRVGPGQDLVVLLAGANDVLARRKPDIWRENLAQILDTLADRTRHAAVVGIPPFALFPSIPATLGRYLTESAHALDEVSRQLCTGRLGARWVAATDEPGPDFFATDRFHPSGAGYRLWAESVAGHFTSEDFAAAAG